jgi:hypothetical protein
LISTGLGPSFLSARLIRPIFTPIKQKSATIVMFAHLIQTASGPPVDASALENAISALESAITALDSSSGLWETLAWVFTGAVVTGVAIEVRVIVLEHRDAMTEWRRGIVRPPDRPSRSLFIWGLVGSILVALGVAGELGVGIKVALTNGALRTKNAELRRKSDQLIALLHVEAQEAKKDAGEANERAEEIKEAIAPRRVTPKQRSGIATGLSRFPKQPVVAISNPFDVEASVLAAEILSALKSAKWDTAVPHWAIGRNVSSLERAPSIPVTGILVQAAPDKRSQLAAKALVRELSSNGFDSRIPKKGVVGFGPKSDPLVVVDVEARPEGPQGEAKLRAEAEIKQQISNQTTVP